MEALILLFLLELLREGRRKFLLWFILDTWRARIASLIYFSTLELSMPFFFETNSTIDVPLLVLTAFICLDLGISHLEARLRSSIYSAGHAQLVFQDLQGPVHFIRSFCLAFTNWLRFISALHYYSCLLHVLGLQVTLVTNCRIVHPLRSEFRRSFMLLNYPPQ